MGVRNSVAAHQSVVEEKRTKGGRVTAFASLVTSPKNKPKALPREIRTLARMVWWFLKYFHVPGRNF